MKRKRLVIAIFSLLASVILAVLLWPCEHEPEYYGEPLSGWLARCNSSNETEAENAREVIRQNTTTALPFLMRWIQHEKPGWRMAAERGILKLPPAILNSRCMQWLLDDRADVRANTAISGFQTLGPRAEAAIPNLLYLVKNTKNPLTQSRAYICIAKIDPKRTPRF